MYLWKYKYLKGVYVYIKLTIVCIYEYVHLYESQKKNTNRTLGFV